MSYDTDRYNLSKLSGQSLAVIECGIQICHPGHASPKLFYKDYSAHFILEGKGVFIKDGASYELCAGQGFLITPNTSCVYIADEAEPWKYVYASFRGADDDTLVHNAGLDESNVIFEFPLDEDMVHDIYAMHRAGKKNEARGYDVTGYFLLVMSRLVKAAKGAVSLQNSSLLEQAADCIGGLCAVLDPSLSLLCIDLDLSRLLQGIVSAQLLDESAVSGETGIRYDYAIERSLLCTHSSKSDLYHTFTSVYFKKFLWSVFIKSQKAFCRVLQTASFRRLPAAW